MAATGTINIGGVNDYHHILFPETAVSSFLSKPLVVTSLESLQNVVVVHHILQRILRRTNRDSWDRQCDSHCQGAKNEPKIEESRDCHEKMTKSMDLLRTSHIYHN